MSIDRLEFDVVIVGAGIAGAALALALDGSPLKVLLLEAGQFPSGKPSVDTNVQGFDARVSALTLASERLLRNLGAWSTIESLRLQSFAHMRVWDSEGTAGAIDFDASEIAQESLGTIVENRVVNYALLHRLQMSSNVKLSDQAKIENLGRSLLGYRFNLAGREIQTQLLVGADGANSFVRQQLDFQTREWDYQQDAIVCTVETELAHQHTAWQCFSHAGPLALLPLACDTEGRNYCSIVWSQQLEQAEALMALDDEAFMQALTLQSEMTLGEIKAVSRRFSFPLRQRHAVNYVKKSAVLVGDAAHTIHPLAGQGINLGLKDIQVLAEELLKGHKQGIALGDTQLLSRYQRRRKADNLAMMAMMEGFKRLFEQQSQLVGLLRNKGMRLLAGIGPLKQQIIKHAVGK